MTILRGRYSANREVKSRTVVFGEPLWFECRCGCGKYFDKQGNEVEVQKYTFNELFGRGKHLCGTQRSEGDSVVN